MRRWALRPALVIVLACALGPVEAGAATPEEKATQIIGAFDDTLISVMQNAVALGYEGRYRKLEPSIDQTFNVPFMTRIVVGSAWGDWSEDRRDQVIAAFRRFIIATYARRFDGYSGEKFTTDGARKASSGILVETRIIRPADDPIALNYLMHADTDDHYQVVDIFLTGTISELATRRSEFGEVLKRDGVDGLIAALAEKSDAPKPN